jgi:hypothetical protein
VPQVFGPAEWLPGREAARNLFCNLGPVRVPGLPGREWAIEIGDAIERRIAEIHGEPPWG